MTTDRAALYVIAILTDRTFVLDCVRDKHMLPATFESEVAASEEIARMAQNPEWEGFIFEVQSAAKWSNEP